MEHNFLLPEEEFQGVVTVVVPQCCILLFPHVYDL